MISIITYKNPMRGCVCNQHGILFDFMDFLIGNTGYLHDSAGPVSVIPGYSAFLKNASNSAALMAPSCSAIIEPSVPTRTDLGIASRL